MINGIKRWFIFLLKYGSPLCLVLIPVLIIYGLYAPWPIAEKALLKHDYNFKIQTGFHHKTGYNGGQYFENTSRSYILFKDNIIHVKSVTVSVDEKASVKIEETNKTVLPLVTSYLLFVFVTWWLWIKKKYKKP
jgi:hypothetical protein